jgi:hypothetical protein
VELLDGAGANAVRRNELLQAGLADAYQRKLGRYKKCVCRDQ